MRASLCCLLILVILAGCIPRVDTRGVSNIVYLPLVLNYRDPGVIGVQDEYNAFHYDLYAPGSWVEITVRWDYYEMGIWHPEMIRAAVQAGHYIILGIRGTPERCKVNPDSVSYPRPDCYDDLQRAAVEMIRQTGAQAIAIYNEPNITRSKHEFIGEFGINCQAGEIYANVVIAVSMAVRAEFPSTAIIAGELDPAQSDFVPCFLKRVDGWVTYISYHRYIYYPLTNYEDVVNFFFYLRRYTSIPILLTETALLYSGDCCNTPDFLQAQVDYYRALVEILVKYGIVRGLWYPLCSNGWMCSDLMICGAGTPVYLVYKGGYR